MSQQEPARQRARRVDSVRNSAHVKAAASELFSAHGLDVSLSQVAERAGVGKATVYRTYSSREEMVIAMVDERLAWLRDRLERAAAGDDPGAAFTELVRDVLEQMRQDRLLQYVVVRPSQNLAGHMSPLLGPLFLQVLAATRDSGQIRADIAASDVAMLMSGAAAALFVRDDFERSSWLRAGNLVLAACGAYPRDVPLAAPPGDR